MRIAPLCVCALLAIAGSAQVPTAFLLVAEDGNLANPGLRYVDPATGVATPVRPIAGLNVNVPRAYGVSVDPQSPDLISVLSGLSSSIAAGIQRVQVLGSQLVRVTNIAVFGPGALANRLEVTPYGTLLAVPGGSLPGLWLLQNSGNLANALHLMPRVYEVTARGSAGFAATYTVGQPSTVIAVDLLTSQTRILGTSYPTLRALVASASGALIAGTDAGELLLIDTTTGGTTLIGQLNLGPIVALTGDLGPGLYVLTTNSEVHAWPRGTTPVYRSSNRVNDIALGEVDHASLLFHGTACGRTAAAGHFAYVNAPNLGNINFTLALADGLPSAPAVLVLGTSRTTYLGAPLPIDLAFLQMPTCSLYTDVLTTLSLSLDASGGARVVLPVPSAQVFRGTRLDAQWFHLDPAANALGLAASDGAEGILR